MPRAPQVTNPSCDGLGWMSDVRERADVKAALKMCRGDSVMGMCPGLEDGSCASWVKWELEHFPGELSGVAAGRFWLHGKPRKIPSQWGAYKRSQRDDDDAA